MKKLSLIFLFMLLASCSATSQIPTTTSTHFPTLTLTSTLTAIPPTPTIAQTLTPTTTLTPLPSWTPLPTLVNQSSFLDFISFTENSVCKFPCWANIIPGQTTWNEAIFALRPIEAMANLEVMPNQESIYGTVNTLSWYLYGGDFRAEGTFLTGNNVNLIMLSFESFSDSSPSYSTPLPKRFNLESTLSEYGIPSMVFIYTFIHDQPGPLPFQVLLIYPEHQFYIEYHRDAQLSGNSVVSCNADFYMKLTVVDNKEKLISMDSINNALETKKLGLQNMKPVEQVLNISPEKFHEIYSASATECMIFPRDRWKP